MRSQSNPDFVMAVATSFILLSPSKSKQRKKEGTATLTQMTRSKMKTFNSVDDMVHGKTKF